eukprot:TRINITY_DN17834_c2_g1_i2.p1 TRINITY_DN17834_c2_g1~~TRINITY_DN17834_c2_g1_i2.p1  ORF type:complete len:177 (-),score=72.60 TRINITY_DN17834_c2_g1_i2:172-702(-)
MKCYTIITVLLSAVQLGRSVRDEPAWPKDALDPSALMDSLETKRRHAAKDDPAATTTAAPEKKEPEGKLGHDVAPMGEPPKADDLVNKLKQGGPIEKGVQATIDAAKSAKDAAAAWASESEAMKEKTKELHKAAEETEKSLGKNTQDFVQARPHPAKDILEKGGEKVEEKAPEAGK